MKNFKTSLCLLLGLMIAPQALAHDMPVPHDHGQALGLFFWAALIVLAAFAASVAWLTFKSKGE